ncbi:hypothetical protein ACTXT7_001490 [Hymenolepis weldensis]
MLAEISRLSGEKKNLISIITVGLAFLLVFASFNSASQANVSRLFLAAFIEPITWLIYLASAILGFGAAVIWTAQGVFITACSTDNNLNRNFGLFWIIFQTNMIGTDSSKSFKSTLGLNLTFATAVYATSLGRMLIFGNDAKSYIGVVGIFFSLGEIGGGQLSTLGIRSITLMRLGFISAFSTGLLTYLMIPPEASIKETASLAFLQPR